MVVGNRAGSALAVICWLFDAVIPRDVGGELPTRGDVPAVVPDTRDNVDVPDVCIADERMRAGLPLEVDVRAIGGREDLDAVLGGHDGRTSGSGLTGGHLGVLKERFDDLDLPLDHSAVVRGEDERLVWIRDGEVSVDALDVCVVDRVPPAIGVPDFNGVLAVVARGSTRVAGIDRKNAELAVPPVPEGRPLVTVRDLNESVESGLVHIGLVRDEQCVA